MALADGKRERIIELVRSGSGRNVVAKEVGVSTQTVTAVATREGLTFDRRASLQATEARKADAKARRTTLGLALLGDLEEARLRLGKAEFAREFQATAQGMDSLMRAYSNLVKLEPDDNGLESATGMVGSILAAIRSSVDGVERMNPTAPAK